MINERGGMLNAVPLLLICLWFASGFYLVFLSFSCFPSMKLL